MKFELLLKLFQAEEKVEKELLSGREPSASDISFREGLFFESIEENGVAITQQFEEAGARSAKKLFYRYTVGN